MGFTFKGMKTMDTTQKLIQFLEEVNRSIDVRIRNEQAQAQTQADALLAEREKESLAAAQARLDMEKTKIDAKYRERLATRRFQCKTALLQRHQVLLQGLFAKLQTRLTDFAASEAYTNWLITLLRKHPPQKNGTVLLRAADAALQPKLEAVCQQPCTFRIDAHIQLGGLCILSPDGHLCENHTLDEAYLSQTRDFYRNHNPEGGANA